MTKNSASQFIGFLIVLGLFATAGCRNMQTQVRAAEEWDAGFVRVLKPAFYDLPRSKQAAFNYLYDDDVSLADRHAISTTNNGVYHSMFFTVLSTPVVEHPEFWARIINDPTRDRLVRWNCLQALVLRHLKPGDPVAKLRSIVGSDGWFGEDHFESAEILNVIPIERREGELVVVLTPDLQPPRELNVSARWIFFSVKSIEKDQEFTVEDVRHAILGKGSKRKLVFTQISVW